MAVGGLRNRGKIGPIGTSMVKLVLRIHQVEKINHMMTHFVIVGFVMRIRGPVMQPKLMKHRISFAPQKLKFIYMFVYTTALIIKELIRPKEAKKTTHPNCFPQSKYHIIGDSAFPLVFLSCYLVASYQPHWKIP